MAGDKVQITISLKDEISAALRRVQAAVAQSNTSIAASFRAGGAAVDAFNHTLNNGSAAVKGMVRNLLALGGAAGALDAIRNLGKGVLDTAGSMETARVRLETMYGSAQKASQVFDYMTASAKKLPQTMPEIVDASTVMKSFGMDVQKWLKPVADMSAYMGISLPEAAAAAGRAFSAGAGAADIFRERGILNVIKDFKGLENATDLANMSLEEFRKAMFDAASSAESGIGGMTDKMAKTWAGQISMMQDAWMLFLNRIADAGVFDFAKKEMSRLLASVDELAKNGQLEKWARQASRALKDMYEWTKKLLSGAVELFKFLSDNRHMVAAVAIIAGMLSAYKKFSAAIKAVRAALAAYELSLAKASAKLDTFTTDVGYTATKVKSFGASLNSLTLAGFMALLTYAIGKVMELADAVKQASDAAKELKDLQDEQPNTKARNARADMVFSSLAAAQKTAKKYEGMTPEQIRAELNKGGNKAWDEYKKAYETIEIAGALGARGEYGDLGRQETAAEWRERMKRQGGEFTSDKYNTRPKIKKKMPQMVYDPASGTWHKELRDVLVDDPKGRPDVAAFGKKISVNEFVKMSEQAAGLKATMEQVMAGNVKFEKRFAPGGGLGTQINEYEQPVLIGSGAAGGSGNFGQVYGRAFDMLNPPKLAAPKNTRAKTSEDRGPAEQGTYALSHFLNEQGFVDEFTAFNDKKHKKGKHPQGLALDFKLKNASESAAVKKHIEGLLRQAGVKGYVKDEYLTKSDGWTGPHMHAQFADQKQAQKFNRWYAAQKAGFARAPQGFEDEQWYAGVNEKRAAAADRARTDAERDARDREQNLNRLGGRLTDMLETFEAEASKTIEQNALFRDLKANILMSPEDAARRDARKRGQKIYEENAGPAGKFRARELADLYVEKELAKIDEQEQQKKRQEAAAAKQKARGLTDIRMAGATEFAVQREQARRWYEDQREEYGDLTELHRAYRLKLVEIDNDELEHRKQQAGYWAQFEFAQLQRMLGDTATAEAEKVRIREEINRRIQDNEIGQQEAMRQGWSDTVSRFAQDAQIMVEFGQQAAERLRTGFSDTFFAFFKRDISSIKDLWRDMLGNIKDMYIRAFSDMLAKRMMAGLFGDGLFGSGPQAGGVLSAVSGPPKGSPAAGLLSVFGLAKFAEGGVTDRPGIFGDAGPEAAVPLSRNRKIPVEILARGTSAPTQVVRNTYQFNIRADDAQSFLQARGQIIAAIAEASARAVAPGAVAADIENAGVMRQYFAR